MPILKYCQDFEEAYQKYTCPEFISPDPLECILHYKNVADREIAGLIASSIAFGNVRQIVRSVKAVLDELPEPSQDLRELPPRELNRRFHSWRHRYADGEDLCRLLMGIRRAMLRYGSLEACFAQGLGNNDDSVLPALTFFVDQLQMGPRNYLLPSPRDGSACKRLNLYLRWMVRNDAVDPGGWTCVPPAMLLVPLDTHMHRMALNHGLTQRKQANLRTALELTHQFRRISPEDPVRYDFALTRRGIWGL